MIKKTKFLAWLLVFTIVFSTLAPTFPVAEAADAGGDELTFNGGYPYGKDMTKDSVTLVAPVEGSANIQWYQSTARDGTYTQVTTGTGGNTKEYKPDFTDKASYPDGPSPIENQDVNKTVLFRQYENGTLTDGQWCPKNWYRCTVNGVWSKPVQLVQAYQASCYSATCLGAGSGSELHLHQPWKVLNNLYQIAAIQVNNTLGTDAVKYNERQWYVSNGYAAYAVYPKTSTSNSDGVYKAFDVIGRYKHRSATQNYYYYWLGEADSAAMGFDTNNYEELRLTFDDEDQYHKRIQVNAKFAASQGNAALVFSPRLGEWGMYYYKESSSATVENAYGMQHSGLISAINNTASASWNASKTSTENLIGIQMLGNKYSNQLLYLDTPAWNITFQEGRKPSSFWLGNEKSEQFRNSVTSNPDSTWKYDPAKYAYDFNTVPYESTQYYRAKETTGLCNGKTVVTSVQCTEAEDKYSHQIYAEVRPQVAISWQNVGQNPVSFCISAGNVSDTGVVCTKPAKCPVVIGGNPVKWRNRFITSTADSYRYDGEPIELDKSKVTLDTGYELSFTTEEVRRMLDVEGDLEYTFYTAEGTLLPQEKNNPYSIYPGKKLDGIPIDSNANGYFLVVKIPDDNPYFTSKDSRGRDSEFYFQISAKPIPVYNVTPKNKVYDGTTKVEWVTKDAKWGDDSKEETKVYERDHWKTWWILKIDAEFEDPNIGQNKKIVGLLKEDGKTRDKINIHHFSSTDTNLNDEQWRNYVPYLAETPYADITAVPAGTANALALPEAETVTTSSIKLKALAVNGGSAEYACVDLSGLTEEEKTAALDSPPENVVWQSSPEFTGLVKKTEYYFYQRLSNDQNFADTVVTSKGAAIWTSNVKTPINIIRFEETATSLTSKTYDGKPVGEIKARFRGTPTWPEDALEYTWYDGNTPLDSPPTDAGTYWIEASVKEEYAEDYEIASGGTNSFRIDRRNVSISAYEGNLLTVGEGVYNGTARFDNIEYDEAGILENLKTVLLPGDTLDGVTIKVEANFQDEWDSTNRVWVPAKNVWTDSRGNILSKSVKVSFQLEGPENITKNYSVSVSNSIYQVMNKAERTIAAPLVSQNENGTFTLTVPDVTGADETAATDGDIWYAVSETDQAPALVIGTNWKYLEPSLDSRLTGTTGKIEIPEGETRYFFVLINYGKNYLDAVSAGTAYPPIEDEPAEHIHVWASETLGSNGWLKDENRHWPICLNLDGACPIGDFKQTEYYQAHTFVETAGDNGELIQTCTVCGFQNVSLSTHTHDWGQAWNSDGTGHWHECQNPNCNISANTQKDGYAEHRFGEWINAADNTKATRTCMECGYEETHTHDWGQVWSSDGTGHWRECQNPNCDISANTQKDGYAEHRFGEWINAADNTRATRTCTECGYEETHTHDWGQVWNSDSTGHWHECSAPGCPVTDITQMKDYDQHSFGAWGEPGDDGEKTHTCTICGYEEAEHAPVGKISLGTYFWIKSYHENQQPVYFSLKGPVVRLSATDLDEDLLSWAYAVKNSAEDPNGFAENDWTVGNGTSANVTIRDTMFSGAYVYLKAEDRSGHVSYSSTPKLIFDATSPKILENGKDVVSGSIYCEAPTLAISDNVALASVTVDGMETGLSGGKLTLTPGNHTVVAEDKAGNQTSVTIKVNKNHDYETTAIISSCVGVGLDYSICKVCRKTEFNTTVGTGHQWGEFNLEQKPTCTEPGLEVQRCVKCQAINAWRTVEPTGHKTDNNKWYSGTNHHWQICEVCNARVNETSHEATGQWVPNTNERIRMARDAAASVQEEHMDCYVCGQIIAQRYQMTEISSKKTAEGILDGFLESSPKDTIQAANLGMEDKVETSTK